MEERILEERVQVHPRVVSEAQGLEEPTQEAKEGEGEGKGGKGEDEVGEREVAR